MSEEIKIRRNSIIIFSLSVAISLSILGVFVFQSPYTIVTILTLFLILWSAYFAYINRKKMSHMCCMMSGMIFGMVPAFYLGTIFGIATSDFVFSMIIGTAIGIAVGVPLGMTGGALGRMEAVMASPMGGIMGAMTGVMIRFYSIQIFLPFFMLVIIFTMWESVNLVKSNNVKIGKMFILSGIILSVLVFCFSIIAVSSYSFSDSSSNFLPVQDSDNIQEVSVKVKALGYEPDYIIVKKDIPVRIILSAEPGAGCTRSIIFPDFNIRKVVPPNGETVIEFTPTKSGTYKFSCSMNMAQGTLIVR